MDLDSYTTVVDGRRYINPEVSLNEQTAFIDNLKQLQQQNNQEIKTDTYNLGTAIPSNMGGLTGAESYFTSRYQVPQTNALVADLRATAQAQALNQALQNELAQAKKRYNDAYKAAQRRANTPTSPDSPSDDENNDPDYNQTDKKVGSVEPSYSPMGSGSFNFEPGGFKQNNSGLNTGNNNGLNAPQNTLFPAGRVDIKRDRFGDITELTYNGTTYSGDKAKAQYDRLTKNGNFSLIER